MDTEDRYTRITLRIPKALHEHLSESAEQSSKSMNAEIIARLEESYFNHGSPAERYTMPQILEMMQAANAQLLKNIRNAAKSKAQRREEEELDEEYEALLAEYLDETPSRAVEVEFANRAEPTVRRIDRTKTKAS